MGSLHISHVDTARYVNVKDDDGASVLVNEDVGTLIANTGGDLHRRQHDQLGDVVGSLSTTLSALLCQLLLPNCCAVGFWSPVGEGFVLFFWIASIECALKAISVRSACKFGTQYSFRL